MEGMQFARNRKSCFGTEMSALGNLENTSPTIEMDPPSVDDKEDVGFGLWLDEEIPVMPLPAFSASVTTSSLLLETFVL